MLKVHENQLMMNSADVSQQAVWRQLTHPNTILFKDGEEVFQLEIS